MPALGEALADADPAMQYRAVLSLKQATGKDLGNSVDRWQQYVKGEQPASRPRRWAERILQLVLTTIANRSTRESWARCRCFRARKPLV